MLPDGDTVFAETARHRLRPRHSVPEAEVAFRRDRSGFDDGPSVRTVQKVSLVTRERTHASVFPFVCTLEICGSVMDQLGAWLCWREKNANWLAEVNGYDAKRGNGSVKRKETRRGDRHWNHGILLKIVRFVSSRLLSDLRQYCLLIAASKKYQLLLTCLALRYKFWMLGYERSRVKSFRGEKEASKL